MNKTHLKIMTPNGLFYNDEVEMVTVKTPMGNIGLQYGKSPFVASIEISEMIIKPSSQKKIECAIAGGLLYVTPESVQIITDAVEEKDKIELSRAEKAKRDAEARLKQKLEDAEHHKQSIALKKAINRISVKKS